MKYKIVANHKDKSIYERHVAVIRRYGNSSSLRALKTLMRKASNSLMVFCKPKNGSLKTLGYLRKLKGVAVESYNREQNLVEVYLSIPVENMDIKHTAVVISRLVKFIKAHEHRFNEEDEHGLINLDKIDKPKALRILNNMELPITVQNEVVGRLEKMLEEES